MERCCVCERQNESESERETDTGMERCSVFTWWCPRVLSQSRPPRHKFQTDPVLPFTAFGAQSNPPEFHVLVGGAASWSVCVCVCVCV